MADPPVVMANFQTDLSAYADVLLPSPLDRYCTWMLRWGEGFLYRFDAVHTVFYPSSPVRRYLLDAGVPASKLVHLGRGVDVDLFNPRHRDEAWRRELAPNGELIIVCVGRLAPEKGFPFLAKAAQRLAERDVPFRLVIVGGNRNATVEDDVRARFEPVRHRVTFTGFLEGEALARAYASADVFAHCSVTETFGLVVLEAMGCGLPVVARDAGGPSEIVRDARSGFLTPPDDLDAFVARLQRLARRADLRREMALAARAQAEDTTWDSINARVAQRMALALEDRRKGGKRFRPLDTGNLALNWVVAFFAAIWTELLWSGTMLVVTFFWTITVIPLIVHGNIVFGARRQDSGPKPKVGPGLVRA
jgi:glycosyltransferase involved in cell wall biosynthesis